MTHRDHIDWLLDHHRISVTYKPGASARAYRKERKVVLRPVKGIATYFTALHEIAHIVGPNPRLRLEQEVAAWRWALDNTEFQPSRSVWKMIYRSLNSYVERTERWASMRLPDPDHDFWKLLSEAKENVSAA